MIEPGQAGANENEQAVAPKNERTIAIEKGKLGPASEGDGQPLAANPRQSATVGIGCGFVATSLQASRVSGALGRYVKQ